MTNDELFEAIEQAYDMSSRTAGSAKEMYQEHIRALFKIREQRARGDSK